jgi:anti-sigma regulatory factor (Ser/Thr protein kinase)
MITPTTGNRNIQEREPILQLAMPRDVGAPALARGAITELCREIGLEGSCRQTLLLLVSEVVSNAVLHSTGPEGEPIGLTAAVTDDAVRVTVTDAGDGFTPGRRDPDRADGGYGLYLLEKAASGWGVAGEGATRVWFEVALDGDASARASRFRRS